MAFGQASGPPASAKKIQELADLLQVHGFDSFKEARHPIGLTQRQASGKFTTGEVDELIERLGDAPDDADGDDTGAAGTGGSPVGAEATPRRSAAKGADSDRVAQRAMRRQEDAAVELLSEVMATELTNRGWCCIPPPES